MANIFRVPRPRSFLRAVSLRTATEFIHFTLMINKLTGLYGIIAIFTGYHLNPLQLSHYIYSVIVLGLVAWLSHSVREPGRVLHNLALAWIYVLDSLIGAAYTVLFGASWFVLLSQHLNDTTPKEFSAVPGKSTMNETAGFTTPEHDVTHVDVLAAPAPGILPGHKAVAYGTQTGSLGSAIFQSGSLASIVVIGVLWTVRFYFCLIVLAYARSVLRQYIATTSGSSYTQSEDPNLADCPFRAGTESGEGWEGKLGRFMLRFPTKWYWLGRDEAEDAWIKATTLRFQNSRVNGLQGKLAESGVGERERRARSGTGPPVPTTTPGKTLS